MARRRRRSEHGQLTVLICVFALCLLLVIAAVTDLSASHLRKRAVTSLADGAALSASDAAAAGSVYGGVDDEYVALAEPAARAAVESYLAEVGAYRDYPGLVVDVQVVDVTLIVQLQMPYRLPFPIPGADRSTTIEATGSATLPIF